MSAGNKLNFLKKYSFGQFDFDSHMKSVSADQLRTITEVDADGNEHEVSPWNERVVETAGYVPLEVRMKQMEQAGLRQQFVMGDLSPDDLRAAWLSQDFEITPDDELEEVLAKTAARNEFLEKLKADRMKALEEEDQRNPKPFTNEEYAELRELLKKKHDIKPKLEAEE